MMAVTAITMMTFFKSVELKVMVLLPDNANHLIEPLYIAVLKQFTLVLRKCVSGFMLDNDITTISKKMQ